LADTVVDASNIHLGTWKNTCFCKTFIFNGVVNINGRDVQRKNAVNNVDKVKFMGTLTKWPVQKHTEHYKTRSIQRRDRH